mmetsp:Transcript_28439/g.48320  ORF Transcript_28439/g.48320 Transcript_28439/m.48320 type:complete len:307 (-) Transcript_28439:1079-1999(-)
MGKLRRVGRATWGHGCSLKKGSSAFIVTRTDDDDDDAPLLSRWASVRLMSSVALVEAGMITALLELAAPALAPVLPPFLLLNFLAAAGERITLGLTEAADDLRWVILSSTGFGLRTTKRIVPVLTANFRSLELVVILLSSPDTYRGFTALAAGSKTSKLPSNARIGMLKVEMLVMTLRLAEISEAWRSSPTGFSRILHRGHCSPGRRAFPLVALEVIMSLKERCSRLTLRMLTVRENRFVSTRLFSKCEDPQADLELAFDFKGGMRNTTEFREYARVPCKTLPEYGMVMFDLFVKIRILPERIASS